MEKTLPKVTKMYKTPNWIGLSLYEMTATQIRNIRERILEAWQMDLTEEQVMQHAKVTHEQYDLIMKKFPEFAEMKREVCDSVGRKARMNIARSVDRGDVGTSKWYLEKTDPKFSSKTRNETTIKVSVEEREERILKKLEQYGAVDFTVVEEDGETKAVDEGEHPGLQALQEDHDKQEENT